MNHLSTLIPTAEDTAAWQNVHGATVNAIAEKAEAMLSQPIPWVGLEHFREYARSGNRDQFREPSFARRRGVFALSIAYALEPRAELLDRLADLAWAVCDEGCWVQAAHVASCSRHGNPLPEADPIDQGVDLFAAETATQLMIVRQTVGKALAAKYPSVSARVDYEVNRRIIRPYLDRNDYWWMGFEERGGAHPSHMNNWNPWINSNALFCALAAPVSEETRREVAEKAARSTAVYLAAQPDDGACDEGAGYWGHAAASAFDCYRLLEHYHNEGIITQQTMALLSREKIVRMGEFIVRMYAGNGEQIMFSDATPTLNHDPVLVADYGRFAGSDAMQELALILRSRQLTGGEEAAPVPEWGGGFRAILHMMGVKELDEALERDGLPHEEREERLTSGQIIYPETQVVIARSPRPHALFAAKGGHNSQNHNHNDLGSFIYRVGEATVVPDLGRAHYSGANFSNQRYTITQNRSAYHSLPLINGAEQSHGRRFEAVLKDVSQDSQQTRVTFALERAYPEQIAPGLSYERTFAFSATTGELVVSDRLTATDDLQVTWTLMLTAQPEINSAHESEVHALLGGLHRSRDGHLSRQAGTAELRLTSRPGSIAAPSVETVTGDSALSETWGAVHRLQIVVMGNLIEVQATFNPLSV